MDSEITPAILAGVAPHTMSSPASDIQLSASLNAEDMLVAQDQSNDYLSTYDRTLFILMQDDNFASWYDLVGLFFVGISSSLHVNTFLIGIAYFSSQVYDSPSIFSEMCVAIYAPCLLIVLAQLYYDQEYDSIFGSFRAFACRVISCMVMIIILDVMVLFLSAMYPKDEEGETPSDGSRVWLLIILALIASFSFALNGSMLQFSSFADKSGRCIATFTSGSQFSSFLVITLALTFNFNEEASSINVKEVWLTASAFVLLFLLYVIFVARDSRFVKNAFLQKDYVFSPVGNDVTIGDFWKEWASLFATIFGSTFLLPFYARFEVDHMSTMQNLIIAKFVSDFLARPASLYIVPSLDVLFYSSIVRFLFLFVWMAILFDALATPSDGVLIFLTALWGFSSGILVSWSYYLAADKFKNPNEKTQTTAQMNVAFNASLGLSVAMSAIWNAIFWDD